MKKNNAGMSLLEVVVVIAMVAILSGLFVFGIGRIGGFRAREGADTVATSLSQAKVATLGKAKHSGNMCWEIRRVGSEFWVRTVYDADGTPYYRDEKLIVDGKVDVWVGTCNDTGGGYHLTKMVNGASYKVYFNRSTGAVCDATGAEASDCPMIRVDYGTKSYSVWVIAKTGKVVSETVAKDR